ncbi:MAG: transglutaminase family protein [Pacificimonas sp.]|jgi:hypothetical protein|nr:transglutaminase family protein [Pacificimonas sp.]
MKIKVEAELDYALEAPADVLLQMETARIAGQEVTGERLSIEGDLESHMISGEDEIGVRRWMHCEGRLSAHYSASVAIHRIATDCTVLPQTKMHDLPSETIKYLMGSRYCDVAKFQSFVAQKFDDLTGGERVIAMRDWVEEKLSYTPGSSTADTTAIDTFVSRRGICRDYAHVLISLVRASAIPARMASVYAIGVEPQDFHAVCEVYLDGEWHLVDPTGMAQTDGIAIIGVGRDAADISFMTVYGQADFRNQSVSVTKIG